MCFKLPWQLSLETVHWLELMLTSMAMCMMYNDKLTARVKKIQVAVMAHGGSACWLPWEPKAGALGQL